MVALAEAAKKVREPTDMVTDMGTMTKVYSGCMQKSQEQAQKEAQLTQVPGATKPSATTGAAPEAAKTPVSGEGSGNPMLPPPAPGAAATQQQPSAAPQPPPATQQQPPATQQQPPPDPQQQQQPPTAPPQPPTAPPQPSPAPPPSPKNTRGAKKA